MRDYEVEVIHGDRFMKDNFDCVYPNIRSEKYDYGNGTSVVKLLTYVNVIDNYYVPARSEDQVGVHYPGMSYLDFYSDMIANMRYECKKIQCYYKVDEKDGFASVPGLIKLINLDSRINPFVETAVKL